MLELEDPLDPRDELVVEAGVSHEAEDFLFAVYFPWLREPQDLELPDRLLVFGREAATDADD